MSKELGQAYDMGYFEGIRNCTMAFVGYHYNPDNRFEAFMEWLSSELEDARKLKDEWNNEAEV